MANPAPKPKGAPKTPKARKPYEEIGAIFNGNEVKIRVPKSTSKPPKLTPSQLKLQQQCTCDDDRSICSETCGFPEDHIGEGRQGNMLNIQDTSGVAYKRTPQRVLFLVPNCSDLGLQGGLFYNQFMRTVNMMVPDDICESMTHRTALNSELVYNMTEGHDQLCSVCNVTPKDAPKGVKAQKVLHPDKDVFILKIGKQTDEPNRTGSIEVELVTPRAPAKAKPAAHACKQIQCEDEDLPCCIPCRTCRVAVPRKKKKTKRARCCF